MAKKTKGVRFIAQTLTKTYKKDFPRYTDALPEARRVLAQLQDDGLNVNKKNIKGIIRPPKVKLTGAPQLPNGMIVSTEYFNLDTYIEFIEDTPKNVYFTSNIFPASVKQPLQAGKTYKYEDLFQPFVNYFNSIQKNTVDSSNGRYTPGYFVHVKTLLPSQKGNKWIAEIIFETDIEGIDYGWNPSNPKQVPTETVIPTPKKKKLKAQKEKKGKKEKTGTIETTKVDLEKEKIASAERIRLAEIELEKKKAAIESAERLLKAEAITFKQYQELIK